MLTLKVSFAVSQNNCREPWASIYLRNADTIQHALGLGYSRSVRPRLVPHHAEGPSREKAVDEPQPRERCAEALDICSMHEVQQGWQQGW